jgi:hypothetical protein
VRCDELVVDGKAPSDKSALKPYWGKPAVRDFRGSGGNVGIIRSPVRATALPGRLRVVHISLGVVCLLIERAFLTHLIALSVGVAFL